VVPIKRGDFYYDEVVAIRRGEVYFVHLDPAFGRELGGYKMRPVVVLSINDINQKPLVLTVVPGTSFKGQQITFRNVVRVDPTRDNGLLESTLFVCHQIRSLDRGRFTGKRIGRISDDDIDRIVKGLKYSLGFP
jgi:mRNA interferase MazF